MRNYTGGILLLNTEDDSVPSEIQSATFGDEPLKMILFHLKRIYLKHFKNAILNIGLSSYSCPVPGWVKRKLVA